MAAIPLFRGTDMAAVTSLENTILHARGFKFQVTIEPRLYQTPLKLLNLLVYLI